MKAVFLIVPDGFRDEEYAIPKDILEKNNIKVDTASKIKGDLLGKLGKVTAKVDMLISEIIPEQYDAIVIIGGKDTYWNDKEVISLVQKFHQLNKVVAAICISAAIPAQAGILQGQKGTVFATESSLAELKKYGVTYTGEPVTVAGKVVTANGPAAAESFGREIVRLLKG